MKLRIEVIDPDTTEATTRDHERWRQEAISVGGLTPNLLPQVQPLFDGWIPDEEVVPDKLPPHVWEFIVAVSTFAAKAAKDEPNDTVKDEIKERSKQWIADFITRLKGKKVRINGREAKNKAEIQKIVSEEIDIGQPRV
jgi:hypothetical protein